jgi:hypothetical protein
MLCVTAGVLAAALYFWQLPHFLSLAWLCRADYARGGYRMLPLIDASGRRTAACALRNCLYLMPLGALAACLGVAGPAFGYEAAILSGVYATTAASFLQVGLLWTLAALPCGFCPSGVWPSLVAAACRGNQCPESHMWPHARLQQAGLLVPHLPFVLAMAGNGYILRF